MVNLEEPACCHRYEMKALQHRGPVDLQRFSKRQRRTRPLDQHVRPTDHSRVLRVALHGKLLLQYTRQDQPYSSIPGDCIA